MLRPFFKPSRNGSLDGWKFSLDDENGDIYLNGANPGTAQEHTPDHHPHLHLSETMIPYPTVEPGDTGKILILEDMDFINSCSILERGYHPRHGK